MSFLSTPNLFLKSTRSHDTLRPASQRPAENGRLLKPKSSVANLIQLARNPLENIGEAVEDWYDGSTKEERAAKQALADRKQLLYLKLRTVKGSPSVLKKHRTDFVDRRPLVTLGRRLLLNSTSSRATMNGNQNLNLQSMTHRLYRHG